MAKFERPINLKLERQKYVTKAQHGKYPVGTECWASRPNGTILLLEFGEGEETEECRLGFPYFAEGIEDPDLIEVFIATLDEEERLKTAGIVDPSIGISVLLGVYQFKYLDKRKQMELDAIEKAAKKAIQNLNKQEDSAFFRILG